MHPQHTRTCARHVDATDAERSQIERDLLALLALHPRRYRAHPWEARQRARVRAALRDLRDGRVSVSALRERVQRLTPWHLRHPEQTTWPPEEVTA